MTTMNTSTKTYLSGLLLIALAALPASLPAQDRANERPVAGPAATGLRNRAETARQNPPSDKEYEQASQFMREHSPNRWQAMEDLPEEGGLRRGVMNFIIARWRILQSTREEDAQLYEIKLKQVTVEDNIYGLLAHTQSPAEREPLRKELREQARSLATLGLAERERRIERLQEMLKKQEELLSTDRSQLDAVVEQRTQALIQDGPTSLRPDFHRRPRVEERRTRPTTKPSER